jgi:quinol monooxygenase YgiN
MEKSSIVVLARVRAREGFEAAVERELLSLVAPSRAEEGCINYDLHRSADDPSLFMFHETWSSREALDKHLSQPFMDAFDERTEGMLAEPEEITFWERLEP